LLKFIFYQTNKYFFENIKLKKVKEDIEYFIHNLVEYNQSYGDETTLKIVLRGYFKFMSLMIKCSKYSPKFYKAKKYENSLNFYYYNIYDKEYNLALEMYEEEYLELMKLAIEYKRTDFFQDFFYVFVDNMFYYKKNHKLNVLFIRRIIENYAKASKLLIKNQRNQASVQFFNNIDYNFAPYLKELSLDEKSGLSFKKIIEEYSKSLPLLLEFYENSWDINSIAHYYLKIIFNLINSLEDDYPVELLELKKFILKLYTTTLNSNLDYETKENLISSYLSYLSKIASYYVKSENYVLDFEVNEILEVLDKKHKISFLKNHLYYKITNYPLVKDVDNKNKNKLEWIENKINSIT